MVEFEAELNLYLYWSHILSWPAEVQLYILRQ